jgi:acetylglutamate kinase
MGPARERNPLVTVARVSSGPRATGVAAPRHGTTIVAPGGRDRAHAACIVVKLGGRALGAPGAVAGLAAELRALPVAAVLVHGGGPEVNAWCSKLGLEPRFVDGLRVTDAGTLEVAAAVLAGLANKRLVGALRAAGVDALGVSALDGGIVRARPHPDAARLGRVGAPESVNAVRLSAWLDQGLTPVVASIGEHEGELLNLNADDVAGAIAGALEARALLLISDTPGVRFHGDVVSSLDLAAMADALAGGEITDGMRPKLRAARAAVAAGAGFAWIGAWRGVGSLAAVLGQAGDADA